jgi:hypothetical protein
MLFSFDWKFDMCLRRLLAWSISLAAFHLTLQSFVAAAEKTDPTGIWTWVRELEGQEAQSVLSLSYKDGKLSGTYKRQGQVVPIANGTLEHNEISFEADGKWNDQKVHGKFTGKLAANEMNGTIEIVVEGGSLPLPWKARRGVDADDLVGTWKLKFATPNGRTAEPELKLSNAGSGLKGTYQSARFGQHEVKEIKLNGLDLSWHVEFERDGQTIKANYKGKLKGRTLKGSLSLDAGGNSSSLEFTGEQTATKGGVPGATDKTKDAPDAAGGKSVSVKSNH